MGNTCKPMAVSFQCMTKYTTIKKNKNKNKPSRIFKMQMFVRFWFTGCGWYWNLHFKTFSFDVHGWVRQHTSRYTGLGLPWWLSGEESASQCRRHGFSPWSGKIPHAMERLSPRITTTMPVLWSPGATTAEPVCHNYWSPRTLEPVLRNKRSPHTTTKRVAATHKERKSSIAMKFQHRQK